MAKLFSTTWLAALLSLIALSSANASDTLWNQVRPELEASPILHNPTESRLPTQGPVIVTFFASWCPPCTSEFAHLNEISSQISSGGATIIGINLHEDFGGKKNPQRMQRFIKKTSPKFALFSGNHEIAGYFGGIPRIPTVVLLDRDGNESWRFVHERNAEKTHATAADILEAIANLKGS